MNLTNLFINGKIVNEPFAIILIGIIIYIIICSIWFFKEGIHGLIIQTILFRHLKKNYYQLWRKITSIGSFGPGLNNPIRYFKWLYKEKHPNDENLLRLIDSLKIRLRYMLFIFLGLISGIIMLIIIGSCYSNTPM